MKNEIVYASRKYEHITLGQGDNYFSGRFFVNKSEYKNEKVVQVEFSF